jgi:uncharacterized protein (TIGR03083 family)
VPTVSKGLLEKSVYLDVLRNESRALARAAEKNLDIPLPSCPGWTEATLLGHLGLVYISIARNVAEGLGKDIVQEIEDLRLAPEYEAWASAELSQDCLPPKVVEWFRNCADRLQETLESTDVQTPVWTWFPPDQTAGFWMRRMAHETAVHRWDAQLAFGDPETIGAGLARDGIDEVFDIYQPTHCRPKSATAGSGETYHFHITDGDGDWLVRFVGEGMTVSRETGAADVIIQGPAYDLLLFLWHRIPAERLQVLGEASFVDRYFDLVPPD